METKKLSTEEESERRRKVMQIGRRTEALQGADQGTKQLTEILREDRSEHIVNTKSADPPISSALSSVMILKNDRNQSRETTSC